MKPAEILTRQRGSRSDDKYFLANEDIQEVDQSCGETMKNSEFYFLSKILVYFNTVKIL